MRTIIDLLELDDEVEVLNKARFTSPSAALSAVRGLSWVPTHVYIRVDRGGSEKRILLVPMVEFCRMGEQVLQKMAELRRRRQIDSGEPKEDM